MKIHIFTHYYPPEIGAPQARLSEMARTWVEKGHEVTVLTGFPNHPLGEIPPEYRGQYFCEERVCGVSVWRHWLYATPNEGIVKKTLCHLSFMFSSVFLSCFRGKSPDLVLASSPTFFSAISAYVYSRLRFASFVFEIRDLWPGIFVELGVLKNKILITFLESIELFLYRKADQVVTVTKGFKQNLIERGLPPHKIEVIPNGADLTRFSPGNPEPSFLKDFQEKARIHSSDFVVLYAGTHGISHALGFILEVASRLQENDSKEKKTCVRFLFVGEGSQKKKLMKQAASLSLKNVSFLPGQTKDNMPNLYRAVDLCLVPLRDIPGFKSFIPSKMFEMMASEKPIVASLQGEAGEILLSSKGGVVISPENADQLLTTILTLEKDALLRERMGKSGHEYVSKHFNRKTLALTYLSIFKNQAKPAPKKED